MSEEVSAREAALRERVRALGAEVAQARRELYEHMQENQPEYDIGGGIVLRWDGCAFTCAGFAGSYVPDCDEINFVRDSRSAPGRPTAEQLREHLQGLIRERGLHEWSCAGSYVDRATRELRDIEASLTWAGLNPPDVQ